MASRVLLYHTRSIADLSAASQYQVSRSRYSESPVGVDQHLCVPVNPLVEFLVRNFSFLDPNLMTNHEARARLSRDDQVSQVAIVLFDVTLSGREVQSLLIQVSEG